MVKKKDCFELLKRIPKGYITTYKDLAHALDSKSYRYIGKLLSQNTQLVTIPCHRVVCSNGSLGGYVGGVEKKKELLEKEGIQISKCGIIINFKHKMFYFTK